MLLLGINFYVLTTFIERNPAISGSWSLSLITSCIEDLSPFGSGFREEAQIAAAWNHGLSNDVRPYIHSALVPAPGA